MADNVVNIFSSSRGNQNTCAKEKNIVLGHQYESSDIFSNNELSQDKKMTGDYKEKDFVNTNELAKFDITHSNYPERRWAEIRLNIDLPICEVKERLYTHTGTLSSDMFLYLIIDSLSSDSNLKPSKQEIPHSLSPSSKLSTSIVTIRQLVDEDDIGSGFAHNEMKSTRNNDQVKNNFFTTESEGRIPISPISETSVSTSQMESTPSRLSPTLLANKLQPVDTCMKPKMISLNENDSFVTLRMYGCKRGGLYLLHIIDTNIYPCSGISRSFRKKSNFNKEHMRRIKANVVKETKRTGMEEIEKNDMLNQLHHDENLLLKTECKNNGIAGNTTSDDDDENIFFVLSEEKYDQREGTARKFMQSLRRCHPKAFHKNKNDKDEDKGKYGNTNENVADTNDKMLLEIQKLMPLGSRCKIRGDCRGKIAYVGYSPCKKEKGVWIGIALDEPFGTMDGNFSIDKQREKIKIFDCDGDRYGHFCHHSEVEVGDFPPTDPFNLDEI